MNRFREFLNNSFASIRSIKWKQIAIFSFFLFLSFSFWILSYKTGEPEQKHKTKNAISSRERGNIVKQGFIMDVNENVNVHLKNAPEDQENETIPATMDAKIEISPNNEIDLTTIKVFIDYKNLKSLMENQSQPIEKQRKDTTRSRLANPLDSNIKKDTISHKVIISDSTHEQKVSGK